MPSLRGRERHGARAATSSPSSCEAVSTRGYRRTALGTTSAVATAAAAVTTFELSSILTSRFTASLELSAIVR
eukprot:1456588-Pleurochrysis_carterae.AAC.1